MQTPPLFDVPRRVVAWHNRHPLARRIQATQVHSVGEVLLPFASDRQLARPQAADDPTAPPPLAAPTPASLAAVVLARAAARPVTPAWAQPPAGDGMPVAPAAAEASAPPAAAEAPADPADIDLSLSEMPALPGQGLPADGPGDSAGFTPAGAAATGRRAWLARLRDALAVRRSGRPRLEAAFGAGLLWPLTLAQVARWARRHGQLQALAPAEWPHRHVAPDPIRLAPLRQKGLRQIVELYLLTAAIGVGDRRIRLLLNGRGQVIGPRAYSRARIAVAAAAVLAAALGAVALLGLPLQRTADALAAAAPAAPAVTLPGPILPAAPAASTAHAGVDTPRPQPTAEPTADPAAEPTSDPASEAAAEPQRSVRPRLSDDARRAARLQAEQLRSPAAASAAAVPAAAAADGAPPAGGPVYAVVSRPSRQRESAASGLAMMLDAGARLPPPVPARAELMQAQGEWRAAWWPFTSLADAERARVMLAGKGLKAEVVEF